MRLPKFGLKQLFFLLKLAGATVIFYLMFTWLVLPIGEDTNEVFEKEYGDIVIEEIDIIDETMLVDQYIDEAIDAIFNDTMELDEVQLDIEQEEGHFAASSSIESRYEKRYQTMCVAYGDLCKKMSWVGDFSSREQYWYFASVVSVVRFLQRYMVMGNDIVDTLRNMTIDNSLGNRRGYATWNEVVLNLGAVSSRIEFLQLVSHEMGHIFDLGAVQGVSRRKHASFTEFGRKVFSTDDLSLKYYAFSWKSEHIRKPGSNNKNFCSGYGMSDPFEDFSECFNLYLYHNALFKAFAKNNAILKKKYNFIASFFDGKYLRNTQRDLTYLKKRGSFWRPWDTTRIK